MRAGSLVLLLLCLAWNAPAVAQDRYDVVVYGGTAGGVAAAVQAARMGRSVLLIEPSNHLGGMTTGGLGATDIGSKTAIGGIAREFYGRVYQHYQKPQAWKHETRDQFVPRHPDTVSENLKLHWFFEPKVAQAVFRQMLDEAKVPVLLGERLDRKSGVARHGPRIATIRTEGGKTFAGRVFLDCTYEGDLMAAAGVSYTVGREPNSKYDETLNGVRPLEPEKSFGLSPFIIPGDRASGLLPGVEPSLPGVPGSGDHRTQAYTFRLCLTDVPENRVPIAKPEGYDPKLYELVARFLQSKPHVRPGTHLFKLTPMPNRKTDSNNQGPLSTDFVNFSHGWAEADHAERERLWQLHRSYVQGLLWFLANDERVPSPVREETGKWGLAKDEFVESGNWPPQLYVREARRMVGRHVITEHDCRAQTVADDPIGLAAYAMDSHQVTRFVDEQGRLRLEGAFWQGVKPYPIGYRSITPDAKECTNLLVPVCLSASHAAYGSIRMEPVFMILGQSAATAASLAVERDADVQAVDGAALRARLEQDGQVLAPPKRK